MHCRVDHFHDSGAGVRFSGAGKNTHDAEDQETLSTLAGHQTQTSEHLSNYFTLAPAKRGSRAGSGDEHPAPGYHEDDLARKLNS